MGTHVSNRECLNCGSSVTGNFCGQCGQSITTQRFTIKQVFSADFLYIIFHIKRGLFFSIKELFTRPGNSVREYIYGKRVNHLNYFTLLVIMILVFSIIETATPFHYSNLVSTSEEKKIVDSVEGFVKEYPKLYYLSVIPLYALFSFLIFRKSKQNYAENIVLNTYKTSAFLLLAILFLLTASFIKNINMVKTIESVLSWITLGYGAWFYYQYFSPFYKNKYWLVIRSILCAIIPFVLILIGLVVYLAYIHKLDLFTY